MLRNLLGWPDARAAAWAQDAIGRWGDNPFLRHEWEAWYLWHELIASDVRKRLGPRLNAFGGRVEFAIRCQDSAGRNVLDADYDWGAAKSRVHSLLELARAGVDPDEMP